MTVCLGRGADSRDGVDGLDEVEHEVVVNLSEASAIREGETKVEDDVAEVPVSVNRGLTTVGELADRGDKLGRRWFEKMVILWPIRLPTTLA